MAPTITATPFFILSLALILAVAGTSAPMSSSALPTAAIRLPGAYGDPHFKGWDGINFDFTGEPGGIYCMISDTLLHVNMKLDGHSSLTSDGQVMTQTWITSLGILFQSHRIILAAAQEPDAAGGSFLAAMEVDGQEVVMGQEGSRFTSSDGQASIRYEERRHEGVLPYDRYTVRLAGAARLGLRVGPEVPDCRTKGEAHVHFNIEMEGASLSREVHGVLGQTLLNAQGRLHGTSDYKTRWNSLLVEQQVDGPNGEGYLDGSVSDYLSSGLLYSDCRFSRFNANFAHLPTALVEVSSGYSRRLLLP